MFHCMIKKSSVHLNIYSRRNTGQNIISRIRRFFLILKTSADDKKHPKLSSMNEI